MEFRNGLEDRDRHRALEDKVGPLAKEDRQRRIAAEGQNQAFTNEQRDRQREDWQRDDAIKGAYSQAADQANATRNADVEGAIQPIEAQGQMPDGKGLPAFKVGDATFTDKGQARAAAEKDVKPFMDYYTAKSAPLVTQAYMRAGQPEKAQAYNKRLKTGGVQKGMESWAKALQAASRDDPDGFAKHITAAYNQQGYFAAGAQIGNVAAANSANINTAGIMQSGTQTAIDGYTRQAGVLTNLYNGQLSAWNAQNNAASQSNSDLMGAIGTGAGLIFSDENAKENKEPATGTLEAARSMPVQEWDCKPGMGDGGRHIGTYAQQFKAATGKGDGRSIR